MNLFSANVVIINKVDSADAQAVLQVRRSIGAVNPGATVIEAASPIEVDHPEQVRGKRVLAIEDGPTVTHGEMGYGAAWVAAERFGAAEVIDPRPFARGSIAAVYQKYSTIGRVLPAMGYGKQQMKELQETINRSDADLVLIGTPIDLGRLMKINKPSQRVRYDLQEIGTPTLEDVLRRHFGGA
jgi:predicted GTPase